MKQITKNAIVLTSAIIMIFLVSGFVQYKIQTSAEPENDYLKDILKYKIIEFDSVVERQNGNFVYEDFVYYFENNYFQESITACLDAREHYKLANDEHNKALSILKNIECPEEYEQLIKHYIDYNTVAIELNWNNYEVCEYYEAAAAEYIKEDLERGNGYLEDGNIKINDRDNLIPEFNQLSADIQYEEEELGLR